MRRFLIAVISVLCVATAFAQMDGPPLGSILRLANTWIGNQVFGGHVYFKSGRPWCDVRANGAVGNGSTNDDGAINACETALVAVGGGILYFPPSTSFYCTFAGLHYTDASITLTGAGGVTGSSAISSCGHGNTYHIIELGGNGDGIVNLYVQGSGIIAGVAPTGDTIHIDVGCVECFIEDVHCTFGNFCINIVGTPDVKMTRVRTDSSYGSAMIQSTGSFHLWRGKLDQAFPGPGTSWTPGSTINNWVCGTVYATNAFVADGGFYLRATVGGTSAACAASAPTVLSYGSNITDGSVTWQLVGPTIYSCIKIGAGAESTFIYDVDCTGPWQNGFLLAGGQNIVLEGWTVANALNSCFAATSGNNLIIHAAPYVSNCGAGVTASGSFVGDLTVSDSSIFGNTTTGINILVGANYNIHGNTIAGNTTWGVQIYGAAGILANVIGNTFGSTSYGNNGTGAFNSTAASTKCNVGLNSSSGATYTLNGCTGTANN
jgi:hypothetical protein